MKLIDMLVEDGMNGWQWPNGVNCITQDYGNGPIYRGVVFGYREEPHLKKNIWLANNDLGHADVTVKRYDTVADDWATAIITREQYEAALAAKNEGWIEWGGGECPVPTGTLVDVKWRDGRIDDGIPAKISHDLDPSKRNAISWQHRGNSHDIIAYRLHQPQEVAQDEADDENDLNECVGQDAAPVWNGEGLPPVGCICEISWAGDEWQQCEILFRSNQFVVVKLKESGMEDAYNIGDVIFRPIRPEEELKREEAIAKITDAICGEIPDTGMATAAKCAARAYDAIAAGKIPGLRLED